MLMYTAVQYPDDPGDMLCLRALVDVNVPKFLKQDVPLFNGIIADLFPGLDMPTTELSDLGDCIKEECLARNLVPHDAFLSKVNQLYQTASVRHGLMVVGYALSGKT
ncbi:dynein heavy chain, partial [Kipferlia bialata]|eukprot:g13234.t1